MPKATKKQEAQDVIERIATLMKEGTTDAAVELRGEAEEAIQACRPADRKGLTADLNRAFTVVPESASAELAISSYHEVEGVDAIVDQGVKQVRDAVDAGLKTADMARVIAETLLDARLRMPNKHGLADITALSKFTKNIAHDTFVTAREGVTEEDVHRWATHQSLAKAVRNRMSDVVVDRLRSLDENPEGFPDATMARARARFPDLSPTEAVYALYEAHGISLPRKGRTELAREDARRRAELVRKAVAGELPAGEVSEEDEVARDLAALERLESSTTRWVRRAENMSPEDRGKLKARLNATIATLAAEAAKL